jgi:hypothetical protein
MNITNDMKAITVFIQEGNEEELLSALALMGDGSEQFITLDDALRTIPIWLEHLRDKYLAGNSAGSLDGVLSRVEDLEKKMDMFLEGHESTERALAAIQEHLQKLSTSKRSEELSAGKELLKRHLRDVDIAEGALHTLIDELK